MIDTLLVPRRSRGRRLPWQAVLAAAAALALLTAVAAGDDEASDVTRRLINEGQIPRGALE